jgi:hypothetical protein
MNFFSPWGKFCAPSEAAPTKNMAERSEYFIFLKSKIPKKLLPLPTRSAKHPRKGLPRLINVVNYSAKITKK